MEMQLKTTKDSNTITRIGKMKKTDNSKCWGGVGATAAFTPS